MTRGTCILGSAEYNVLKTLHEIITENGDSWQNQILRTYCMRQGNVDKHEILECARNHTTTFRKVVDILLMSGILGVKKYGNLTVYYFIAQMNLENLIMMYIQKKEELYGDGVVNE